MQFIVIHTYIVILWYQRKEEDREKNPVLFCVARRNDGTGMGESILQFKAMAAV